MPECSHRPGDEPHVALIAVPAGQRMTQMVPGEMIVRKDGRDNYLAVGEGLVEVTADRVAIVTDMAVRLVDQGKMRL